MSKIKTGDYLLVSKGPLNESFYPDRKLGKIVEEENKHPEGYTLSKDGVYEPVFSKIPIVTVNREEDGFVMMRRSINPNFFKKIDLNNLENTLKEAFEREIGSEYGEFGNSGENYLERVIFLGIN
ncbi:MAG: hypothetical protein CMH64_00450 [Nanoarchaeota archaeon]|nr:hypothetical protein [Nanoarchaeota archaeon]|tara:strand:- start:193 stop:567 length:375 start_codon:yes stop_codon:yes gene_type:complete